MTIAGWPQLFLDIKRKTPSDPAFVICVDVLVYDRHLASSRVYWSRRLLLQSRCLGWDDHPSFAFPPTNITNSLDSNNKLYQELDHQEGRLSFHPGACPHNSLEGDIGPEGTGLEGIDPGGTYIGLVDIDCSQNTGPVQASIVLGQEKGPVVAGYNTPSVVLVDNMPVDLADPGRPLDSCLTGPVGSLHNPRIPRMWV